jgi:hypothetical protein
MNAHLDDEMSPLFVDYMEVVVVHIGPRRLALQMGNAILAWLDFPYKRRRLGNQYQKKTLKGGVFR